MAAAPAASQKWKKTACILCSLNCGLEVLADGGTIHKVRGDKAHPMSEGYTCQKALRLNHYQNSGRRLTAPLRRKTDGTFEEVSWETAIEEIAAKLVAIRDQHGGGALAYYGGGGQGNHLGGAYGGSLRAAMETRYIYTSLAQEKTGGFWIDGRLFGKQNCHPTEDVENADYLLIIGANPWQSHGFPQARTVLQQIAKAPERKMIVVDPRRTETADKADLHLQLKPGGDAHFLLAMLGTIVQEGLENTAFIAKRTTEFDKLRALLTDVPVDDYALRAGLEPEVVRRVARDYAAAERACVRTDLGLEHSLHSTLNVYLSKLLYLVTGHFGKPGTNTFHTSMFPLVGHSKEPEEGGLTTAVTRTKEIGRIFPPNVLPQEILADHPKRIRGLFVDSSNPAMTGADSQAYRDAFKKLELLVVVDVAMTETARHADYILPAATQFEKWEATFFGLEFPKNFFHLRRPLFEPQANVLPEPEIYRRLCVAMGAIPERFPLLEKIAKLDRRIPRMRLFPMALAALFARKPQLKPFAPVILYDTLGKALPRGAQAAALVWVATQLFERKFAKAARRAGIKDRGAGIAEGMLSKILESESGLIISENTYEETWDFLRHKDKRIHLFIPEMAEEIRALATETLATETLATEATGTRDFPFVLMAGERRSYNANTIIRNESWRKKDPLGRLKMNRADAADLGLSEGGRARCSSARGAVTVEIEVSDELQPGVVSMPHGYGMDHGDDEETGPLINLLTSWDHCDALAKTPFHKHVPVRVEALVPEGCNEVYAQAQG